MAITCTTICSCTCDDSLSLEKAQTIEFSDKENLYIENLNKSYNVSTKEALDEILKKTNTFTRGNNDLKTVGILYKEELGIEENDTLLPDTLAYFFESSNEGKRFIVSADNRVQQSILAEYNTGEFEDDITETGETIGEIIRQNMANYIRNEIINYEAEKDSITNEIYSKLSTLVQEDITRGRDPDNNGYDDLDDRPTIEEEDEVLEDWHAIVYKEPMIIVEWDQYYPYNGYIKDTLSCRNVPTGCVATAVAQLMTKWKYPYYSPNTFWFSLTMNKTINIGNPTTVEWVASLLKTIFVGCQTIPGCSGSSSTIENASLFLSSTGYTCDEISSYNSSAIYSSITNGCPVLISGAKNQDVGHAWDIDGCCKEQKTIKRYIYKKNANGSSTLIKTQIIKKYRTMFHHNWGWGGTYNGWLVDGCFNAEDYQRDITRSTGDHNYCYDIKISTNIHPSN